MGKLLTMHRQIKAGGLTMTEFIDKAADYLASLPPKQAQDESEALMSSLMGKPFNSRVDLESIPTFPNKDVQRIVDGYTASPPMYYWDHEDTSLYDKLLDRIYLSKTGIGTPGAAGIAFHEMIHSTGAKKRLNRPSLVTAGIRENKLEELTADLGRSALMDHVGLLTEDIVDDGAYHTMQEGVGFMLNEGKQLHVAQREAIPFARAAVNYILGTDAKIDYEKYLVTPDKIMSMFLNYLKQNLVRSESR